MANLTIQGVAGLYNPSTNNLVGLLGVDGKEYLIPVSAAFAPTLVVAAQTITTATINGGTINNTTFGATTRNTIAGTQLSVTGTDISGTPGNGTANTGSGRAAIAAAATTVTVTNSQVAVADHVLIQPRAVGTPTKWAVVTAAGSFTVTVDLAPAATWPFDFIVIKN